MGSPQVYGPHAQSAARRHWLMGRSPRRGGRSRSAAAAAAAWLLLSLAVGAAAAANGSLAGALRRLRGRSNSRAVCCVAAATGLPAAVCSRRGCTCEARLDLHCTSGGSISAGVPGPSGVHQHRTRGPYEWQRVRHDDVLWHPRSGKLSREGLCFIPRGSSSIGRSDSAARRRGAVLQGADQPVSLHLALSRSTSGLPCAMGVSAVRRRGRQTLVAAVAGGPVPRLAPGGGTARSLKYLFLSEGACLVRERRRERRARRPRPAELRAATRAEPAGGGPSRAQPGPGRGAARAGAGAARRARARRAGRGHCGARRQLRWPGAAVAGAALWRRAHRGAGFPLWPRDQPCLHGRTLRSGCVWLPRAARSLGSHCITAM